MTTADQESRRKLLAVDDDGTIRALLHTALQGHYDIHCVPNGPEVPGLIAGSKPDIILLDINVPGSESYALCAGIRDQAALESVPILFMTVCRDNEGFFENLRTKGNSFIRKPFAIPALEKKIAALLK
ncbi:MAG: response regulator [Elusimicrobiota bacterium]|jgi:DNA-binding response OmpR family regulator